MAAAIGKRPAEVAPRLIFTKGNNKSVMRRDSPPLTRTGTALSPPKTGITAIMALTLRKMKMRVSICSCVMTGRFIG